LGHYKYRNDEREEVARSLLPNRFGEGQTLRHELFAEIILGKTDRPASTIFYLLQIQTE
jgi:hypothetical protein